YAERPDVRRPGAPASSRIERVKFELGRRVRLVVADVRGRDLLGLLERIGTGGADPDRDPVADPELRRRDHRRDAAAPEDEDRPRPVAERLVERLAEHLAEPEAVPALDVDRDLAVRRGRVERSDEQPQRPVSKPGRRPAIGDAPG